MDDVEFRLGRAYRTRPLAQGCIALVLAAALYAAGLNMPAVRGLAVLALAYAAGSFAVCARNSHVRTRLTAQGIEIRRYRRKVVPWPAVSDIKITGSGHAADAPVTSIRTRTGTPRGRGPRTVAKVEVARARGHRVRLPAPLVTSSHDDPDFDDKAELIKTRWRQAIAGTAGHYG